MKRGKIPQLDKDMEKKPRAITTHNIETFDIFTLNGEYNKKCLLLITLSLKWKVFPL